MEISGKFHDSGVRYSDIYGFAADNAEIRGTEVQLIIGIIIIIIIIKTMTIFIVLSIVIARVYSVHLMNVEQRRAAADPQTKPLGL